MYLFCTHGLRQPAQAMMRYPAAALVEVACETSLQHGPFIGVYSADLKSQAHELDHLLLAAAVLSAFAGAFLGNRYLTKLTMQHLQRIVAAILFAVGLGLIFGVL